MALSVKHTFQSGKDDGTDSQLVRPSNWNAEHTILATAGVVLGRPVGATPATGPVTEITIPSLIAGIVPPGAIMAYGGLNAPSGWLMCNGASYLVASYGALAGVIGYQYGGAGPNFNVPNLQGRVPAGSGGALLNGSAFNKLTPGGVGGAQSRGSYTLTSSGTNYINYGNVALAGGTTVANSATSTSNVQGGGGTTVENPGSVRQVTGYTPIAANHGITVYGGVAAVNIVQPTLIVNFIIKT